MSTKPAIYWSAVLLAVGLITPFAVIFYLEVFVAHIDPTTSIAKIMRLQYPDGLIFYALFGLIPFVALSMVCFAVARRLKPSRLACVVIGGLVGILGLMVPGHVAVWYPLYGPDHMSSTAVVAFFFIPFYCIVTLCIGSLFGWLISLLPIFRHATKVG